MRLPRFLWVGFALGRPFGAPHEPDFQRRVLGAALSLLERSSGPVLEDFPDDAPVTAHEIEEAGWSCPVSFPAVDEGKPALVKAALAEVERLEPWIETGGPGGKAAFSPVAPVPLREIVEAFGEIVTGGPAPEFGATPLQEWVRLGCDDLHHFAIEASRAQPGSASIAQREDWFWKQTAIARLIGETASALLDHDSPMVRGLARRAMVPRAYIEALMPGSAPFI